MGQMLELWPPVPWENGFFATNGGFFFGGGEGHSADKSQGLSIVFA